MYPMDDPEKKRVPGYPQDMWMDMSDGYQIERSFTASGQPGIAP